MRKLLFSNSSSSSISEWRPAVCSWHPLQRTLLSGHIKSIESSWCLCPYPANLASHLQRAMKALSGGRLPGGLIYGLLPPNSQAAWQQEWNWESQPAMELNFSFIAASPRTYLCPAGDEQVIGGLTSCFVTGIKQCHVVKCWQVSDALNLYVFHIKIGGYWDDVYVQFLGKIRAECLSLAANPGI